MTWANDERRFAPVKPRGLECRIGHRMKVRDRRRSETLVNIHTGEGSGNSEL